MTAGRHQRVDKRRRAAVIGLVVATLVVVGVVALGVRHAELDEPASKAVDAHASTVASSSTDATASATDSAETQRPSTTATEPSVAGVQVPTTVAVTSALTGRVVVIDPGHNGGNGSHTAEINRLVPAGGFSKACDTTGAETNDGYPEHAFTFDVSMRVADLLRSQGATVYLTRVSDSGVGPCVDQRAAAGGDHDADVAISIHGDGGPAYGRGFHVLPPAGCNGCSNEIVAPSSRFAEILRNVFRSETPMPTSTYLGSEGIMPRTDLAGLNLSTVPKVFIECGNMRNATDAALMKDPTFRETAAKAIADGISLYLGSH